MGYLFVLIAITLSLNGFVSGQYVDLDEDTQNALDSHTSTSWTILLAVMGVFLVTTFIAFCYHRRLIGCDPPQWMSLLLYFICTIDFLTDLLFFAELSIQQHTLTFYAGLFLFGSHCLSTMICIIYILRWKLCPPHNNPNKAQQQTWMTSHACSLIFLTLFGNLYGTIEVSNCQLFHFSGLNMQASLGTRSSCHFVHIVCEVLAGSFPLMIIEMAYMSLNEYTHISIAATAMIFSFISIAIGIFIIVSKLCNNLVEILIPTPYMEQGQDKENTQAMCRSFVFKSNDLDRHHCYAHKCIANAISIVLQVSDYQVMTTYIEPHSPTAIQCAIEITPEMNDRENLSLFLNLLEAPSSGLYDVLAQQIASALAINEETLHIDVRRDDVMPPDAAGGGGGPVEWTCAQCTFINHFVIDQCEVCGNPRYSGGIHGGVTGANGAGHTDDVNKNANDEEYGNQNHVDVVDIDDEEFNHVMVQKEKEEEEAIAMQDDIELAKAQSIKDLEANKNVNDFAPVASASVVVDDNDFLKFVADGHNQMEPKEPLKMIADDNQNIDTKDMKMNEYSMGALQKPDDIIINQSMDLDANDANDANQINFIKHDHAANNSQIIHRRSTTTQSKMSTGFEISEINEIDHDIIAPVFDIERDNDKEKEEDLFADDAFPNDGLNDDFDDLRQSDAFFG
eukprot:302368_1